MDNNVNEELDINQLMKIRREKLDELRKEGKDPFAITKYNREQKLQDKLKQTMMNTKKKMYQLQVE